MGQAGALRARPTVSGSRLTATATARQSSRPICPERREIYFEGLPPLSKALDRAYDGIVIGAGHHGLILGTYLARAGLDILLVDRRLTYGGGLCTREVTLPGFYHNLHSINHFHISETPWFKDLNLDERVAYITPRYEFGQAHHDGSALVLGRDRLCERARISLGAVSPTPMRAKRAEALISNQILTEDLAERAAAEAAAESKPISDVRSSADYRREMVRVLVKRALQASA